MPTAIHHLLLAAFEPDNSPIPGELTHFLTAFNLTHRLELPAAYRPLWSDGQHTLALATGVGTARAAASVMALGLDPRFDLSRARILLTGVAGITPSAGPLASVILPEYVVDGSLVHELDAREIPVHWPDGFVPLGKTTPYEEPRAARFDGDDGIVFRLNPALVAWASDSAQTLELVHGGKLLRGDELASSTYYHGRLLSERASRWVAYQTSGAGHYAITAMEDAGILQALTWLAQAQRVDLAQVLIARGASNWDGQREGLTAAESLAASKVPANGAYRPALENAFRVGSHLLQHWPASSLRHMPLPRSL